MFIEGSCILVIGAGGGGDVVSAYLFSKLFENLGYRVLTATIVWERYVRDPEPGPIPLKDLYGLVERYEWSGVAKGSCYSIRRGVFVEPAACRLAREARSPIGLLDASLGELGVRMGLEELAKIHGCDAAVSLDVGGDILAKGCEPDLWSPLADSLTLAATALSSLRGYVAVYAPGADGELPPEVILERVGGMHDGLVAAIGMPAKLLKTYAWLIERVGTEAGLMPLYFISKGPGVVWIRGGSRRVKLSPLTVLAFILDAERVYRDSIPAQLVAGSISVWEASRRLNEAGIFTELDLEVGISLARSKGLEPTPSLALEVREEGRRLLGWKPCS